MLMWQIMRHARMVDVCVVDPMDTRTPTEQRMCMSACVLHARGCRPGRAPPGSTGATVEALGSEAASPATRVLCQTCPRARMAHVVAPQMSHPDRGICLAAMLPFATPPAVPAAPVHLWNATGLATSFPIHSGWFWPAAASAPAALWAISALGALWALGKLGSPTHPNLGKLVAKASGLAAAPSTSHPIAGNTRQSQSLVGAHSLQGVGWTTLSGTMVPSCNTHSCPADLRL